MQRPKVVHPPALRIAPHEQDDQLVEETRALMAARPDVVLVTTGYGVRSGPRGGAGAFADDRARVDRGRGRRAGRKRRRLQVRGAAVHGYTDETQLARLAGVAGSVLTVTPYRCVRPEAGDRLSWQPQRGLPDPSLEATTRPPCR
jgi:uroporphyrinogen-III synthase